MRNLLHVGCGPQNINSLKGFPDHDWNEIRFDIDINVNTDLIGTLTDMSSVKSNSIDAIYSSHNIEHIFPHEVDIVFNEFIRVLKSDGFLAIACPDLQSVCENVAKGNISEPLYISPAGPISAMDIIYGHIDAISKGNTYMAHRCGFTWALLNRKLHDAGFQMVFGGQYSEQFALKAIASKSMMSETSISNLFDTYIR